jgi:hypothetical protein
MIRTTMKILSEFTEKHYRGIERKTTEFPLWDHGFMDGVEYILNMKYVRIGELKDKLREER